jgi:hypothetical protein
MPAPSPALERFAFFQAVQKALGNAGQAGLGSGKRAGEDGARLVLPSTIHGVQHGGFEVAGETGGQVVGCGKLVIDRARHAVYQGYLPCGLYGDAWIRCGGSDNSGNVVSSPLRGKA